MKSERRKFGIVLLFAVIFTTLAFVNVGCASGIPPEEAWNKTFGGASHDGAFFVQQTSDGGYIIAGDTMSYGAGSFDFWLVKTYSNGSKQWDRTFGGTSYDCILSVQQTSDDGYILAGYTESYGAGGHDFWLVKTDSEGNKQWERTFGGTEHDYARSVRQTSDGGYVLTGGTRSYGAGNLDFWLVKTDSKGNKEWDRTFGGTGLDWAHSVRQTSDGGYVLVGCISHDFWLVKTDSEGNKEWDKTFGGDWDHVDDAYSVQQTYDGGYILAGGTKPYDDAVNWDFWLVKTDSEGNKEWDTTFGGVDGDGAHSVQQTSDGGYIIAGDTMSYGAGGHDFWLVKTDSEGNKEWDKTFGGVDDDRTCSVQQTSDDGYILAGYTESYGAGLRDAWLIKVGGTSALTETVASTGAICVESTPSEADVYLDGVYHGVTGSDHFCIYGVSPGYHTIALEKYGYEDYTEIFFISAGGTPVSLSVSLSAIPAPTPGETLPPETSTPRSASSSTPAPTQQIDDSIAPVQTPPPEQKDKTTQTIEFVGGVIFLAAAALLAGMLVGKFHKKRRGDPKRDERKHETHKKPCRKRQR